MGSCVSLFVMWRQCYHYHGYSSSVLLCPVVPFFLAFLQLARVFRPAFVNYGAGTRGTPDAEKSVIAAVNA